MSDYRVNKQTGHVIKYDGRNWVNVNSVRNKTTGEILIEEGNGWQPLPGMPARTGVETGPTPKMRSARARINENLRTGNPFSGGGIVDQIEAMGRPTAEEMQTAPNEQQFEQWSAIKDAERNARLLPDNDFKERMVIAMNVPTLGFGPYAAAGASTLGALAATPFIEGDIIDREGVSGAMSSFLNDARVHQRRGREERPIESYGGEIIGGLLQGKTIIDGVGKQLLPKTNTLSNVGRVMGTGAGYSGLYAFGQSEKDLQGALGDAAGGAVIGAGVGLGFKAAEPAITAAYRGAKTGAASLSDALSAALGKAGTARDRVAEDVAIAAVRRSMERSGMTFDEIMEQVKRYEGKPAVLAEVIGQDAVNALTALTRRPGATPQKAQAIIEERQFARPERMIGDVEDATGIPIGQLDDTLATQLAERQAAAKPVYDALYKRFNKIEAFRQPGQTGQVMKRLNRLARTPLAQRHLQLAKDAVATAAARRGIAVSKMSTMEYWDLVKRSLDDAIDSARSKGESRTRVGEGIEDLVGLKNDLVDELDRLTGGAYAAAREIGGEAPRLKAAAAAGQKVLQARNPREVAKTVAATLSQDLPALRAGVVDDLGTRINKGMLPSRVRVPDVAGKLRAALGPDAANRLIGRLDAEAALAETGARWAPRVNSITGTVMENSASQMGDDLINAGFNLATGNKLGLVRQAINFMRQRGFSQRQIDAIGDLLLSSPEEGLRRLRVMAPEGPPAGAAAPIGGNASGPGAPPAGGVPPSNGAAAPPTAGAQAMGTPGVPPQTRTMGMPGLRGDFGAGVGGALFAGAMPMEEDATLEDRLARAGTGFALGYGGARGGRMLFGDAGTADDIVAQGFAGRIKVPGMSKDPQNRHGLMPHLRMQARVKVPEGAKAKLLQSTDQGNVDRQLSHLNGILDRHPDPFATPNAWAAMMADALGTSDVPVAPYAFIRDLQDGTAAKTIRSLTPGQVADADHGFRNARQMLELYTTGVAQPADTGKLFAWGFLSRGVSPYTQEAMFIDAFNGIGKWIDDAAAGRFNETAYLKWAETVSPKGSGQPGSGASHNLNAFGVHFLKKMSQPAYPGANQSKLEYLHQLMADPNMTGPQIRREFARIGTGVGIDNKVVSFALLVSGRDDVMVLDRVQMKKLWNDGRFDNLNLYDGFKDGGNTVTGSALSSLTYGARGLLIYEAIERALQKRLADIYAGSGRESQASIGRYHWETWVAASQQEASHGTLDAITKAIRSDPNPLAGVTAKEGEYGAYSYGARYGLENGERFIDYPVPGGGTYRMSPSQFSDFREAIKKPGNKVVPGKFKVTDAGDQPWYNSPQVNVGRLDEVAGQFGRRLDDGRLPEDDGRAFAGANAAVQRSTNQSEGAGPVKARQPRKSGSGLASKAADATAIAALAAGGPTAQADTGDAQKRLAELSQREAAAQQLITDYEQGLKDFRALSVVEKQEFLKANGFLGSNGKPLVIDGKPEGNTAFAIKTYEAEIDAATKAAQAERELARSDINKVRVGMAERQENPPNPLIDKAAELGTYAAMIYGAHRLRGAATKGSREAARLVADDANALLTRLPVPPKPPKKTLLSQVPIVGRKEKARIARATAAANRAARAVEERLAGRDIPPISSNPTSENGLPIRQANLAEFDRRQAAGDFGPVGPIGRFMEPLNSRVRAGDLGLIGAGAADAHIMQGMLDKTRVDIAAEEQRLKEAREAADPDLIAASNKRLEQLRKAESVQTILQRVGVGLMIGGTVGLAHGRYSRPQPRFEAAGRERELIRLAQTPSPPPVTPPLVPVSPQSALLLAGPPPTKRTGGKPRNKPPVSFSSNRPRRPSNDND